MRSPFPDSRRGRHCDQIYDFYQKLMSVQTWHCDLKSFNLGEMLWVSSNWENKALSSQSEKDQRHFFPIRKMLI